jgi:hypothetical protein
LGIGKCGSWSFSIWRVVRLGILEKWREVENPNSDGRSMKKEDDEWHGVV